MAKPATVLYHPSTSMGHGESVQWDDNVNPYGDPGASNRERWRFANGGGAKFGSTPAQRAGEVKGYVPGVGAVAEATPTRTPDAQWREKFASTIPATVGPQSASQVDPYGDWRGHQGVSNPPPMNNVMPGQAATNSLADHIAFTGAHIPVPTVGADGTKSNIPSVQQNMDIYAPGGMRGAQVQPMSDNGYVSTGPQEMANIAKKYANPNQVGVTKVTPAVDSKTQMDPYA